MQWESPYKKNDFFEREKSSTRFWPQGMRPPLSTAQDPDENRWISVNELELNTLW